MNRKIKLFAPDLDKGGELAPELEVSIPDNAPLPQVVRYDNRYYVQRGTTCDYEFVPVVLHIIDEGGEGVLCEIEDHHGAGLTDDIPLQTKVILN